MGLNRYETKVIVANGTPAVVTIPPSDMPPSNTTIWLSTNTVVPVSLDWSISIQGVVVGSGNITAAYFAKIFYEPGIMPPGTLPYTSPEIMGPQATGSPTITPVITLTNNDPAHKVAVTILAYSERGIGL